MLQCASASGFGVGVGHRLWRRLGCIGKLCEGHLENFARASGAGLRGGEPKLTLCDVGCDSQLIVAQKHKLRSSSKGSFQRWNVAQALRSAVRRSTRERVGPMPVFTEPVRVRWKLEGQCGSVGSCGDSVSPVVPWGTVWVRSVRLRSQCGSAGTAWVLDQSVRSRLGSWIGSVKGSDRS